jgi:magnesium transporter
MDALRYGDGGFALFYRILIMDIRYMENLEQKLNKFEEEIFDGNDIDINDFYRLKKNLLDIKKDNPELLELHSILEAMLDKQQNELMNRRLNLLTIWSTIFLPLSFYTGFWGMNFDDVPLITDDSGFWVFMGLTILTIGGIWIYFKKKQMVVVYNYDIGVQIQS